MEDEEGGDPPIAVDSEVVDVGGRLRDQRPWAGASLALQVARGILEDEAEDLAPGVAVPVHFALRAPFSKVIQRPLAQSNRHGLNQTLPPCRTPWM